MVAAAGENRAMASQRAPFVNKWGVHLLLYCIHRVLCEERTGHKAVSCRRRPFADGIPYKPRLADVVCEGVRNVYSIQQEALSRVKERCY